MAKEEESSPEYCITFDDVLKAAGRVKGVAHKTPVLTSETIISNGGKGQKFFFKVEAMQKTGSFKFRGALNAIREVLERKPPPTNSSLQVVTHSSGNHAQALALAAKLASTDQYSVKATIVMPNSAPAVKKAAVESYEGNIVMVANTNEAREDEADRIVEKTGATFIHPSENPRVIAGQGTACLEFVDQVRSMGVELNAVIIPVGGGGLAAGNTIALRGLLGDKVKVSFKKFL